MMELLLKVQYVEGYEFYLRLVVFCVLIFPVVCPYISYILEVFVTHLSFLAIHYLLCQSMMYMNRNVLKMKLVL